MYCKYCGKQIDEQAKFCLNCGKNIDKKISISKPLMNKPSVAKVLTVVLIMLSFYGIFPDIGFPDFLSMRVRMSEREELSLGFVILFLIIVCAIILYKIHVYLTNIICLGVVSIVYLVRIIDLSNVLRIKYVSEYDYDSFKTLYWAYFIILSVLTIILTIKYLYKYKRDLISNNNINMVMLSGMHRALSTIGFLSCLIIVPVNYFISRSYVNSLKSTHGYESFTPSRWTFSRFCDYFRGTEGNSLLSILSYSCIGLLFLYVLLSYIKNNKSIMKLHQCISIALFAFIIQLCSSMFRIGPVENSIVFVLNLGLCFCFYKIRNSYTDKIESNPLKLFIRISMICLLVIAVIGIFDICKLITSRWFRLSNEHIKYMYLLRDIIEESVTIVLLLFLNNLHRILKTLDVRAKESEE